MVKAISIAVGGPEWRYKAAVVFAADLLRWRLTGPGRIWKLYVLLQPTVFSDEYRDMLKAAYANVRYERVQNTYQFNTERYLVHDRPEVTQWIAMDSHYDFRKEDIEKVMRWIVEWNISGKAIMTHSWGKHAPSRPWSGGWFGVRKSKWKKELGYEESMQDLLNEYFQDDLHKSRQDSTYGDDERILGLIQREVQDESANVFFTKTWYSTPGRRLEDGKKLTQKFKDAVNYILEYTRAETTEDERL